MARGDKTSAVSLVAPIIDVICGAALCLLGVYRLHEGGFENGMTGLLQIILGGVAGITAILRLDFLVHNIRFLCTWLGRGIFYLLLGITSLQKGVEVFRMALAGGVFGVGFLYVILSMACCGSPPIACIDCTSSDVAVAPVRHQQQQEQRRTRDDAHAAFGTGSGAVTSRPTFDGEAEAAHVPSTAKNPHIAADNGAGGGGGLSSFSSVSTALGKTPSHSTINMREIRPSGNGNGNGNGGNAAHAQGGGPWSHDAGVPKENPFRS